MPTEPFQVIGDVHGRADLLDLLLDDLDLSLPIAFVGDIIDRGPYSAQALEIVFALCQEVPEQVMCLLGNHEMMLIEFLQRPTTLGRRWLRNGGTETLESYGIYGVSEISEGAELTDAAAGLRSLFQPGMEEWLKTLPTQVVSGNTVVTHAGLDPLKPVEVQDDRVRIWGCAEALTQERVDGIWSVHGHYIVPEPYFAKSRVAIDTGAFHTSVLTAARFSPSGQVTFSQTV